MRRFRPRVFIVGCFFTACCFLCHCGARHSGIAILETDDRVNEAGRLLRVVLDTNAQVNSIKGIGFVKMREGNQVNTFRAAWIGSRPRKFRLEILAATGQPVMSFASDGKRQYLLSYFDNRLYRKKTSEDGLKRLISITITPEDILDLLSGRLPVRPGSRAAIDHRDGSNTPILMVASPNGGDRESIFPVTDVGEAFHSMERRDRRGKLKFKAVFEKVREENGFQIPEVLTITNDNGAMIQITVERCWVNPVVTEDRFVLKLPG